MKKHGVLNSEIAKVLADLGHTDTIVIGDMGLPVPKGVKKIDLALVPGKPSFIEVLQIILEDMQVEKVTLASEIKEQNEHQLKAVEKLLAREVEIDFVPHSEFKTATHNAQVVIRTGENTAYSNIILVSGVTF